MHRHESAMGIHVSHHPETPSHLPPHPIPLGCPRAPALSAWFIELAVVINITYGNIHVSVLFSHIISPSPSPTESGSLFFTYVSFAVLHIEL